MQPAWPKVTVFNVYLYVVELYTHMCIIRSKYKLFFRILR